MADKNDNNKEAVEEQKRQSFLLKRISEKLEQSRKEEAQAREDLEKSMTAFPPAVLKGNKELQQTVARMRSDLKETIEAVSEEVSNLETQEIAEEQNSQRREEQRELVEKYGTWFEKLLFSMNSFSEDLRENTKAAFEDILGMDFKEKFFDGVNAITKGINKLGDKIGGLLSKGAGKVGGWLSAFFDILKQGAVLAAGLVAFTSFLDGWEKATKWFGENADFGDKLASGLAGILGGFVGLDEEAQKKMAVWMAGVFDDIEKILKNLFGGVIDIVTGFVVGDTSKITEGLGKIIDAIGTLLGNPTLLAGATTIMALKYSGFIFKTLIPWIGSVLASLNPLGLVVLGVGALAAGIVALFVAFKDDIVSWIKGLLDFEFPSFDEMGNKVKEFMDSILENITPLFKQIISGLIEAINFLIPGERFDIENPYKYVNEDAGIEVGAGASFKQLEEAIASNQNLTEEEKQREIDRMTSAAAGGMSIQQYVSNNASNQVITAPFRTQPGKSNEATIRDHTTDPYAPAGA